MLSLILIGLSSATLVACSQSSTSDPISESKEAVSPKSPEEAPLAAQGQEAVTKQNAMETSGNDAQEKTEPEEEEQAEVTTKPKGDSKFKTIEWLDLMPKDDLDALMNPPEYITEVEDGSLEDQISNQLTNTLMAAADDRYQQALTSTKVIKEMDGKSIRMPGFVVPLEFSDQQRITQFFLVPYFGACIHTPPPPPNQVVYVNYPKGFEVPELARPYWVSGNLKTKLVANDTASAAYSLNMEEYEPFEEVVY